MAYRAIASVICAVLFGILFIAVGFRRILGARRAAGKLDAVVWGSVGICIGVAFIAGAAWLLKPVPPDQPNYFDPTGPHLPQ